MTEPVKRRGRGRPRRSLSILDSPRERRLWCEDFIITEAVYHAVFKGHAVHDGIGNNAMEVGQRFAAKHFRRKLTLDGVKKIVERMRRDPHTVAFRRSPSEELRLWIGVLGHIFPEGTKFRNGAKTLRYREEDIHPGEVMGDRDVPEHIRKTFPRVVRIKQSG